MECTVLSLKLVRLGFISHDPVGSQVKAGAESSVVTFNSEELEALCGPKLQDQVIESISKVVHPSFEMINVWFPSWRAGEVNRDSVYGVSSDVQPSNGYGVPSKVTVYLP